ncbi:MULTISPECIES: hypothetical protein, partial [unclassified Microcoleus]
AFRGVTYFVIARWYFCFQSIVPAFTMIYQEFRGNYLLYVNSLEVWSPFVLYHFPKRMQL